MFFSPPLSDYCAHVIPAWCDYFFECESFHLPFLNVFFNNMIHWFSCVVYRMIRLFFTTDPFFTPEESFIFVTDSFLVWCYSKSPCRHDSHHFHAIFSLSPRDAFSRWRLLPVHQFFHYFFFYWFVSFLMMTFPPLTWFFSFTTLNIKLHLLYIVSHVSKTINQRQ